MLHYISVFSIVFNEFYTDIFYLHILIKSVLENKMYCNELNDLGPCPAAIDINCEAKRNNNFRTALWTGEYLQMTLMCIPVCGDIGTEIHEETDQYIRVEHGKAMVQLGDSENCLCEEAVLCQGNGVFVPAGKWHNIVNIGCCPLKLSSVYAPPHHPAGVEQRTK